MVRPRRALVLGAGGVLGFAWTIGALSAVVDETGFEDPDIVMGTSAGSVLAALLASGLPVDGIRRHHQGVPAPDDPLIAWDYDTGAGGALPRRPGLRLGSPRLAAAGLRPRAGIRPVVALSGLLPTGRGTLDPVAAMVRSLRPRARAWPRRPQPWIVSTDYATGERVVFGWPTGGPERPLGFRSARAGGTPDLGTAVAASCAIPAWYRPVVVDGRAHIDGGTASNTSLDLLLDPRLGARLEQVVVLAPMAATHPDKPRSPALRVERAIRRAITRSLESDAAALRAAGVDVVLLTPEPADLALIGVNMMDPTRRQQVLETAHEGAVRRLRSVTRARRTA
ncbi:patatin-like phospholipase family protein [Jatrophihabitans sp. YIM 134969]